MSFDFRGLDALFDSRVRLGILALLLPGDWVGFVHLRDKLDATDGNIARHLRRLEEARYVRMRKSFVGRRPCTSYSITAKGRAALENHVALLARLLESQEQRGSSKRGKKESETEKAGT